MRTVKGEGTGLGIEFRIKRQMGTKTKQYKKEEKVEFAMPNFLKYLFLCAVILSTSFFLITFYLHRTGCFLPAAPH